MPLWLVVVLVWSSSFASAFVCSLLSFFSVDLTAVSFVFSVSFDGDAVSFDGDSDSFFSLWSFLSLVCAFSSASFFVLASSVVLVSLASCCFFCCCFNFFCCFLLNGVS